MVVIFIEMNLWADVQGKSILGIGNYIISETKYPDVLFRAFS